MGWRIAIVDDDRAVRRALSRLLVTYDFDVRCYASAGEFLQSLKRLADCGAGRHSGQRHPQPDRAARHSSGDGPGNLNLRQRQHIPAQPGQEFVRIGETAKVPARDGHKHFALESHPVEVGLLIKRRQPLHESSIFNKLLAVNR